MIVIAIVTAIVKAKAIAIGIVIAVLALLFSGSSVWGARSRPVKHCAGASAAMGHAAAAPPRTLRWMMPIWSHNETFAASSAHGMSRPKAATNTTRPSNHLAPNITQV